MKGYSNYTTQKIPPVKDLSKGTMHKLFTDNVIVKLHFITVCNHLLQTRRLDEFPVESIMSSAFNQWIENTRSASIYE